VIEAAVFAALEREVNTLDLSGAIGRAGEELGNVPTMAERKRDEIKRELGKVEERLNTLLECITPENKEIISEKMVALRRQRDNLKGEIESAGRVEAQVVESNLPAPWRTTPRQAGKLAGRLVELSGKLKELWPACAEASAGRPVAELCDPPAARDMSACGHAQAGAARVGKKEFLSLLVDSISICGKRKIAQIFLSGNYLEMKKLSAPVETESFLFDGRGDWI